jgi:serine/threonine-protein kinase
MTSERWRRVEQLYDAALQRPPSERGAFLDAACGADENLRRDVERLIIANDKAGDFLASPAWEVAPEVLATQT